MLKRFLVGCALACAALSWSVPDLQGEWRREWRDRSYQGYETLTFSGRDRVNRVIEKGDGRERESGTYVDRGNRVEIEFGRGNDRRARERLVLDYRNGELVAREWDRERYGSRSFSFAKRGSNNRPGRPDWNEGTVRPTGPVSPGMGGMNTGTEGPNYRPTDEDKRFAGYFRREGRGRDDGDAETYDLRRDGTFEYKVWDRGTRRGVGYWRISGDSVYFSFIEVDGRNSKEKRTLKVESRNEMSFGSGRDRLTFRRR